MVKEYKMMRYLREELLPHRFCSGCGNGIVLNAFIRAIDGIGLDPTKIVCVSGIGCSSWIPSPYFKSDTLHTTHGRPIAFATGVKVMRPDLKVVVIAGDGDIAAIGGNHLIHAARRNIALFVIMVNNMIYGMTGGQVAPTTPKNIETSTTPYKNIEPPFKMAELVLACGATYVARWTTYHVLPLTKSIQKGIMKRGFSYIEVISQCPEYYGRRIGIRRGIDFLKMFKENSILLQEARLIPSEELEKKIVVGEFCDSEKPEFVSELQKINKQFEEEK
jgi:2-oxoglutarate ferredoxin oxidoreductase subunit beta